MARLLLRGAPASVISLIGMYSKSFGLQQGSKRMNPDELTGVSDSGEWEQRTPLQREGWRV